MSNSLSIPPTRAWATMPREFVNWFELNWKALVQNISAIQGVDTSVGDISDQVNLATTNLATLQTAVDTLGARATTDEASITAIQTQQATDETAISGKLAKASNLSDVANVATARANLGLGSGASGTITIPKLTTANGSITLVNGIITAFVNPT